MRTSSAILSVLLSLALAPLARSQTFPISTLAGSPGQGSVDGTGSAARFANPWGVAVATNGDIYIADTDNHTIRKITSAGVVTTLAGTAGLSGTNNGAGSVALFNQPQGITVDHATNVYVSDTGNHTIRKIAVNGTVTTLAGSPGVSGSTDNTGAAASFYGPQGIVVNGAGTLIYVADTWNHTIRQITAGGAVTTLAGSSGTSGSANGTGTGATFNQPQGLTLDIAGNVYVGDTGNQMIRMITSGGIVTTLAGSAGNFGSLNASGTSAQFWGPQGLATDSATNIYVADSMNNAIRKITSTGVVSTYAGSIGAAGSADGTSTAAQFSLPQGVAVDSAGNVYVADSANGTIRKITNGAVVTTLAGFASTGTNDATGGSARFFAPAGSAIDNAGNTYVADTGNNTIRKITSTGDVTTLAGSPGVSGSTDATGGNARFNRPQGITVDLSGNVYVADTANHTIRKITSGGAVTLFAGGVGTNDIVDGTGAAARFNSPQGLAVDSSGNVYVADTWNHTIRKITSGGAVTTVAGLANFYGNLDSNMPEFGTNKARFYAPEGVAVDISGNIYVADTRNHTIRKVTAAGVVSTLAGVAGSYGSADGTNNAARFNLPQSVTVDANTNLYVVDSGNHTIRKITPSGTNWIVTTIAGKAGIYGSADGNNGAARFFFPASISVNASGSFAVADLGNNTIRTGSSVVGSAPIVTSSPQSLIVGLNTNAVFSVAVAGSVPLVYQWLFNGANISGAAASTYTVTAAQSSNAGSYSVIVTNTLGSATSQVATLTVIIPPAITAQPQNVTTNQGANVTFTVAATGTSPAYQWLLNGSPISTATDSTLARANVQPGDEGSYSVIVSNFAGSVTSSNAVLVVNQVPTPPSISSQPQNVIVSQSSNATFSVAVTGSTPLTYKWLFSGTPVAGGTASSYIVTNSQSGNVGSYSVIVTNAYGAATSTVATLSLVVPPIISVQPASQIAQVSNTVNFSVSVSQGTSPSFQWRNNGANISGATTASLTLPSVTWASAASYSVIVSNSAGTITSSNAILKIQQAAFTFFDGFEADQLGSVDNNTVGGPNAATSLWWATTTATARGLVVDSSSGVAPHTGSQMVGTSGVTRQDYLNLLYRMNAGQVYYGNILCDWWFYDPFGTNATGANASQDYLALCANAPISSTSDGSGSFSTFNQRMSLGVYNGNVGYSYSNYQARIVGGAGSFGSANSWTNTTTVRTIGWHHARMVVGIPDSSNFAPVNMYLDNMTNAVVTSPTTGTTFGFNLIELNHDISSATGAGWYYDDLTFRAANDPWIVEQPLSQNLTVGQTAYFNTVAVGTAYQWQLNGTNIAGATVSSYSVPSANGANAGSYTCAITGTNGVTNTTAAVLTFTGAPAISGQSGNLALAAGATATFSVSASGSAPLAYQWRFNGTNILNATNNAYIRTNVQTADMGTYTVTVTNSAGAITSTGAALSVNNPPVFAAVTNLTVHAGAMVIVTNVATDIDFPAQTLTFNLLAGAPATSTLSTNGIFTWLTTQTNVNTTNPISVRVVDNGIPSQSATNNFTVTVIAQPHLQALVSGTAVTLGWSAIKGDTYRVQYKSTLDAAAWTDLTDITATNAVASFTDSTVESGGIRFYRILLVQ